VDSGQEKWTGDMARMLKSGSDVNHSFKRLGRNAWLCRLTLR